MAPKKVAIKHASFAKFSLLPAELRDAIRKYALPLFGTSITIYIAEPAIGFAPDGAGLIVSKAYREPPPMLSVWQESRYLALLFYTQGFEMERRSYGPRYPDFMDHEFGMELANKELWWDPGRDSVGIRAFQGENRYVKPPSAAEGGCVFVRRVFDERITRLSVMYELFKVTKSKRWLSGFPGLKTIRLLVDRREGTRDVVRRAYYKGLARECMGYLLRSLIRARNYGTSIVPLVSTSHQWRFLEGVAVVVLENGSNVRGEACLMDFAVNEPVLVQGQNQAYYN